MLRRSQGLRIRPKCLPLGEAPRRPLRVQPGDDSRFDPVAALAKLGQRRLFTALESGRGLERPEEPLVVEKAHSRAHALADIAERLSESGYGARAHQLLDEADLAAHEIPQPDLQRQTVQRVRTLMGTLPR